jgi:hypothetical protein
MRTVLRRIYAAHLTACRGILEQLEQVEIDAFPTAFVTNPPSGRGFTSNSPLWKVQASAGEQYPPARWSRTTASTVPTTTLKAEDVLEAEIFIKWQAESSCHIGLLGCSMGLTVS